MLQRRSSTRDFLTDCPDRVAELFHYWDAKRAGRLMPRRCDIAPEDFVAHLPGILLVDVEGVDEGGVGIFRYRVVGTDEVRLRGHDPTGKLVRHGFWGPSLEDVMKVYEQVRRERTFLYDPRSYQTPDGRLSNESTLFLPLSEDGETVSQILVYAISRELDSWID